MVHCRTPFGAWKHANRSFERGYLTRPPLAFGMEILPPPAPPLFTGVETTGNRKRLLNWCDMSDDILETSCPAGDVCLLLDAPVSAKEFSLPKVLCLYELVGPDEKEENVVAEEIFITVGHGESDDTIRRLRVKCRALEEEVRELKEGMRDFAENLVATSSVDVSKAVTELVLKDLAAFALTMQTICADLAKSAVDSAFAVMKVSDICQEVSEIDEAVEHYVDDAVVVILDVAEEHYVEAFSAEEEVGACDCTIALEDTDNIEYLLHDLKLRVYRFPKFVWNISAKDFKPTLLNPEDVEFADETYKDVIADIAENIVDNTRVVFDIEGEFSQAQFKIHRDRIKRLQFAGLNLVSCDLLCKICDSIEFVPQSNLCWVAYECASFLRLEAKFFELIASRPKLIQQHMKVYSFFRSGTVCAKSANASHSANSFASLIPASANSAQSVSLPLHDSMSLFPEEEEDYYSSDYDDLEEFRNSSACPFVADVITLDTQGPSIHA